MTKAGVPARPSQSTPLNYADTGHVSRLVKVEDDPDRRGYIGPPESPGLNWHVVTRPSVNGCPCWQPPWSSVETEQLISGANPITYMGEDGKSPWLRGRPCWPSCCRKDEIPNRCDPQ